MTAKEKALEIIESLRDGILDLTLFNDKEVLVKCAIIHVKGIIEVLNDAPTSNHKYSKLVFYHSVLKELNQV
ncbi:hypothetical protein [Sphingobacterium mizutaii]|uniref:hypothetical protein n=1 Tax=Sphingobacterium mizutaii TaxID=1010 RepID=UPI00289AF41C|nr:hypothetical protein [Sphingobacterium mizutaii]